MPSAKTEATELSVGFGLLGFADPTATGLDIDALFEGTLSPRTFSAYVQEYLKNTREYQRFTRIGLELRRVRFGDNVTCVCWTGIQQQAATVMASKDLFVPAANTPISVKDNSNVVANPSPHNLFRSLPAGMVVASQAEDWFLEKDYSGIQALYAYASGVYNARMDASSSELPGEVGDYYRQTKRAGRKHFQNFIKSELTTGEFVRFNDLYVKMCAQVARESADEFNAHLAALPGNTHSAVYETVVKQFFRINSVAYILAGLDGNRPFAVQIPDLTTWKRDWMVQSVRAQPRPGRGQSVVEVLVEVQNKTSRERYSMPFHVEIRWSHGKFCGNPEGKLYKEFAWRDTPFFVSLF